MPEETDQQVTQPANPPSPKKSYKFIRWDDTGNVAHLTMARPPQNVMNIDMLKEMGDAIESLNHREGVRLVLLESAAECEGYFSAGLGVEGYTEQLVFQMMDAFHNVFRAMMDVSKPVLAVVDGIASGAGSELAAFCDLVIATENTQFRQPEIKLGVFPPLGAVVYPRVIGPRRAMEFLLTGEPINARTALEIGLVNRVVPTERYLDEALGLAAEIAARAPLALRLGKEAVNRAFETHLSDGIAEERQAFYFLFASEDQKEGMAAFVDKRKPKFSNR